MRLQKYMALCGVASRRKSETLISAGAVAVNGQVVREQGYKLREGDSVSVNGEIIRPEKDKIYILLNKPAGVVSTASDEAGRKTVLDFVRDISARLYPVGRLDYGTRGLIILTNDGAFTEYMTHPSHRVGKTYVAVTVPEPGQREISMLRKGVDIGGHVTAPARAEPLKGHVKGFKITIYEGRNRQVRRMAEAVGLKIKSLERIGIGNVFDARLKPGTWRYLTQKELKGLGYDYE